MQPFRIEIPEQELNDLNLRLRQARWPDQIGDPWDYGTDLTYLRELCDYWAHTFDWRAQETKLNAFDQAFVDIDGQTVHCIHQRSTHANAKALLLTHGWPGSFIEFRHMIEPLTQPELHGGDAADAFHVICPSIPGYGFSPAPTRPGFQPKACAHLFAGLMHTLGYDEYFAQGGDMGAAITTWLGALDIPAIRGIHLNLVFVRPPKANPMENVSDAEQTTFFARQEYMRSETGYQQIQGTKPHSLGYGLNDSPIGLAAWIGEKFHRWSQHDGDPTQAIDVDDLLTNISIYWFTQTITASMRMYYESRHYQERPFPKRVETPTAVANFPGELSLPPKAWVAAQFNLQRFTHLAKGGHFAALEAPELLTQDIREAFRELRG